MRMTENKRRMLEALRGDGEFIEYGPPPYCAADVVLMIGGNVPNTSRTLRLMTGQGLAVSETRLRDQWCSVPKPGHYPRAVACYWNAETMEQDKARADEWLAGSTARSEAALDSMMRKFYPSPYE